MNPAQQKAAAREFVKRWKAAEGNEDREARSFWIEFAQELLGIPNATYALDFERRVKGRKIDVFYEDMGILIENKSRGCSLDEKYVRSKKVGAETPYEQAKWYADNLPYSVRPRWIITCNFDEVRIHNLDHVNPGSTFTSVTLEELPDMLYLFGFFTDKGNSRIEKEKQLSVKAGELVGKLYDELASQYQNIDTDPHEQRSLNVLCVRLVFLLYAEDALLLARRGQFYDYLKNVPSNRLRNALMELFDVLDTPEDRRDPYLDPELAAFPYINGGLFTHEDIVIPNLTDQIKVDLLAEASAGFDWKDISPTIFGAAFESTLNPETRRAGGMHYTSPENIHRVIDPLFLDDLKAELAQIEGLKTEIDRVRELRIFQRKLSTLTFLDPAAGSHNFLTETYVSLRKLELRVIENLQGDQTSFDLIDNPIMVNIGQFYAIEINDFAVSVGKTALWIAEQQMMDKTQELLPYQRFEFLPLKSITNSVCANALRIDWNDVLPAEKCSYTISNPPFLGHATRTDSQAQELRDVWGMDNIGRLDYVTGWYKKAIDYLKNQTEAEWAFVSTSSITQGEPVPALFGAVFDAGWRIKFAHRTFAWGNEASNQAHVHVVIVGFTKSPGTASLFSYPDIKGDPVLSQVENINGYLLNAPNIFINQRRDIISPLLNPVTMGNMPRGEDLIISEEDYEAVISDPIAAKYVRPFMMGKELLNNKKRYCLWMENADLGDIEKSDILKSRISAVKSFRLKSKASSTREMANTSHLFGQRAFVPTSTYVGIPSVFSERRKYATCSLLPSTTIPGNKIYVCDDPDGFQFAMFSSFFFISWQKAIGGRLESRCNFSNTVVWNNFPVPDFTANHKQAIIEAGKRVLDVREQFPDKSLADLYDPDKMPDSLKNAHELLDAAVEAAYGVDFDGDEEKIVAHLFKLYAEMTGEE